MSLSEIFFLCSKKKEDEMLSQLLQWSTFSHLEGYVLIWLGVNFVNVLRTNFLYERRFGSIF